MPCFDRKVIQGNISFVSHEILTRFEFLGRFQLWLAGDLFGYKTASPSLRAHRVLGGRGAVDEMPVDPRLGPS